MRDASPIASGDSPEPGTIAGTLAWLNLGLATVALILAGLGLLLFFVGQREDPHHAGLWGMLLAVIVAPFAPAFWIAGKGWRSRWRYAWLVQILPFAVAAGWWALGAWQVARSGAPAP